MPATEQFTVTLSQQAAEVVRAKVSSGEYASENEVIQAGILQLANDELFEMHGMKPDEFDDWLRAEVVPVLDAMKADPSRGRTPEQVRQRLQQCRADFEKAG
jgi:antitoxin ParD1/3/4